MDFRRNDAYMGCDAEVIAVGPLSQRIIHALEYPPSHYLGVLDGATLITTVFDAMGTTLSQRLAECFGVGAWDLGKHVLDPFKADLETLRTEFDEKCAMSLVALRDAGFKFYYLPHG